MSHTSPHVGSSSPRSAIHPVQASTARLKQSSAHRSLLSWLTSGAIVAWGWLVLVGCSHAQDAPPTTGWRVGAAKVDISPALPIWLNGYAARTAPATSIEQPIWARALVIQRGDQTSVVVAVEGLGVSAALRQRLIARWTPLGIRPENAALCATHTHNGPFVPDVAPVIFGRPLNAVDQARSATYAAALEEKVHQAVTTALANCQGATLSWTTGSVGFAANRRTPDGPVDHRLPLLVARRASGELIATLATYACHCTTLGAELNAVHGDWAGVAARELERAHPELVALITIGCGADANPAPRPGLEFAEQHGRALSAEIERLLTAGEFHPLSQPLSCRSASVGLPFDQPPTVEQWQEKAKLDGFEGYRAQLQLQQLQRTGRLPSDLEYEVMTWSFGQELAMVFLPGEVVVDYAIRIASDFDADRMWVHAYANDAPCYIPSRRIRLEGGYEGGGAMVYYNQPAPLVPESEDLILDTVQRLLPHDYYGARLRESFPAPLSPAESISALQLSAGLRAELVAAEPLIVDPVAFDWGPDGRLWVVEMRDYPQGIGAEQKPGGRVVVLTDTNSDGTYDQSTLFVDGLNYPAGIKVWRNGILITAAPHILWIEDRDGDGIGEHQEPLYTGFGEGNQQHRVNGLRWGVDNWLYLGNGDSHGEIRSTKTDHRAEVSGRDLRIDPDTGRIEAQSGQTQFGRTQNDFGEWFGNDNSNPLWHYVLDDHYLRRNPYLNPPPVKRDVPVHAGIAPVYPASRTLERFNDLYAANRFTSACSPEIYRDDLLGPAGSTHVFVCEPVHNLVHREIMSATELSYTSDRPADEQQSEFLASRDNWFRPVMVRTGPDGAVWVADMYRYVIEHPTWIPADFQRKMDVRAGDDRGRIYRIYPEKSTLRPVPRLDQLSATELVHQLTSRNGWVRDMAQQLLLWQDSAESITPLRQLVQSAAAPATRIQALHTLAGLQKLDAELLLAALADPAPEVQQHAVRLSEPWLDQDEKFLAIVREQLQKPALAPRLRLQIAYSLGASRRPEAAELLAQLLIAQAGQEELVSAGLSSVDAANVAQVLQHVLSQLAAQTGSAADVDLAVQLAAMSWRWSADATWQVISPVVVAGDAIPRQPWQLSFLARLLDELPAGELTAGTAGEALQKAVNETRPLAWAILDMAGKPTTEDTASVKMDAVKLLSLGLSEHPASQERLIGVIRSPESDPELQMTALLTLVERGGSDVISRFAVDSWLTLSPALRSVLLEHALGRPETTLAFVQAVGSEAIPLSDVPALYRQRLTNHPDTAIRQLAQEKFVAASSGDREQHIQKVLAEWQLPGDSAAGKKLFEKHCAACHRLGDLGQPVGPDLAALTDRSPLALLHAILAPNRAVEDKYFGFTVETASGLQLSGLVQQETSNQITLATPNGQTQSILRSDIIAFRATGKSFMPEGFELEMPPAALAHLVTFIRTFRPPSKEYANHEPRLVSADSHGTLALTADCCHIYGNRLIFEQKHRNLGWWEQAGDHAIWEVQIPRSGRYQVELEYACANDSAGSQFRIVAGPSTVSGTVEGTGSWDDYRTVSVGTLELPAGISDIVVTNGGAIERELFDLKRITLQPTESAPAGDSEPAADEGSSP